MNGGLTVRHKLESYVDVVLTIAEQKDVADHIIRKCYGIGETWVLRNGRLYDRPSPESHLILVRSATKSDMDAFEVIERLKYSTYR